MKTKIAASLVFVGVAVLVAVAAYLTQLAPSAPGDSDPGAVVYSGRLDSYLAVAPAILRAGQTENISVSLFDGAEPAQGTVQLALMQDGVPVAQTNEFVQGVASVPLTVPALGDGDPAQTNEFVQGVASVPLMRRFGSFDRTRIGRRRSGLIAGEHGLFPGTRCRSAHKSPEWPQKCWHTGGHALRRWKWNLPAKYMIFRCNWIFRRHYMQGLSVFRRSLRLGV